MSELLRVEQLSKSYVNGRIPALQGVSLTLQRGETLGLVGESSCGKTTLGRSLLRLCPPDGGRVLVDGRVFFDGALRRQPDTAPFRRRMQMIFQDPGASLDPRKTARQAIGQALSIHRLYPERRERQARIEDLLRLVGLGPGQEDAYPHQLSGGQQQRVAIARVLAVEPEFLVCDEPVSALDLSIQAQILALLRDLQEAMGLAVLFIGHDLSVVRQVSHRIAVMYAGRFVEEGPCEAIIGGALHPYTRALLAAVPAPVSAAGAPPSPRPVQGGGEREPGGCPYLPHCPFAEASCRMQAPERREVVPGRFVACHRV